VRLRRCRHEARLLILDPAGRSARWMRRGRARPARSATCSQCQRKQRECGRGRLDWSHGRSLADRCKGQAGPSGGTRVRYPRAGSDRCDHGARSTGPEAHFRQCVVEPGCTLPALRWLFDHEPETMALAHWILTCKDWRRFRLTGEIATDEKQKPLWRRAMLGRGAAR
jgi:hypothetical protein